MSDRRGFGRTLMSLGAARLFGARGAHVSPTVYMLVIALGLGGGAYCLWRNYADQILMGVDYTLTAEMIEITPPPPWIRADIAKIKAQAVVEGSLSGMNLTRTDLAVRVADAFAMHPWVAKVNYTEKRYGRVAVELDYRRPVAMVWVTDEVGPGLLPIDAEGVLLPTADFLPEQARSNYLHVEVRDAKPSVQTAGSPWGDQRVHGAAQVAAQLLDIWKELGLSLIVVIDQYDPSGAKISAKYRLSTRDGRVILWGHAPGEEVRGELTARRKVARLSHYLKETGPLNKLLKNRPWDLSQPAPPFVARRIETGRL